MGTDFYKRYEAHCSEKYPYYENLLHHRCEQVKSSVTQGSYGSRKTWKKGLFGKKSGKTWKTQGIFRPFLQPQGNSGNFILPNISDQIGGALRINEASK